ncbi:hypothetical protein O3P69_019146 [Scylla paramamosain]|uniref:Uncharacterized protein n=1 Tax=Scylla paramamosain TaxID=85552 RepID=A0AAW0SUJ5_SCYPA
MVTPTAAAGHHRSTHATGAAVGGRSQGRGLMAKPWEGEMVLGSGGWPAGRRRGRPLLRTSWRMDNLESEVAFNILNAVLTDKEEAQWARQRDWEGRQKRRMDWDDQYYGSGCGILRTPQMPPR